MNSQTGAVPNQANPNNPPDQGAKSNRNERRRLVGISIKFVLGAAAVVIPLVALEYGRQQAVSAKDSADSAKISANAATTANDRASGRIQANVAVEKGLTLPRNIPDNFWVVRYNQKGVYPIIHLKKLEDLALLNPVLGIRNAGDEPIEAVKIDVRVTSIVSVFAPGEKMPKIEEVRHIIGKQSASFESPIDGKLMKGDVARVSIIRVLLEHILDWRNPKIPVKPIEATFKISCFGKLPGASGFDGPRDDSNVIEIELSWDPSGFPEEMIRSRLSSFQPTPDIIRVRK